MEKMANLLLNQSPSNIFQIKQCCQFDFTKFFSRFNSRMNLEDMYNTLPRSLKTEVLVASKIIDDPEVLQARQELIKTKTPKELSVISGLDDFPLPTKIETLVRKNRRGSKASKEALSKR